MALKELTIVIQDRLRLTTALMVSWVLCPQGLLHYLPAAAQPTIPPDWCFCLWTTLPLLPPIHHLCSFPDVFSLAASSRWYRPPWRTWWPSSPTWAPMCPSSRRSTCTRPSLRAWWVQRLSLFLFILDFCLKVSMLSYRLTTFMLLAFVSLYSCCFFLQKLTICFIQMAMVTCPEWISGKGNFIDCMHGGSIADDVINRYCYIQVLSFSSLTCFLGPCFFAVSFCLC